MHMKVRGIGCSSCDGFECLTKKREVIIVEWSFALGKAGYIHWVASIKRRKTLRTFNKGGSLERHLSLRATDCSEGQM